MLFDIGKNDVNGDIVKRLKNTLNIEFLPF